MDKNSICTNQNQQESIELLAAQRHLYSKSKNVFYVRCIGVIVFIIIGFVPIVDESIKSVAALGAIVFLFLDILVLEKVEDTYRATAAKVQELFDCKVLEMEWNDLLVGHKPDNEVIFEEYNEYKRGKGDLSKLPDWYPRDVCNVEMKTARSLCQRCNIVWDARQRRGLIKWLIVYLIIQSIATIVVAVFMKLTVSNFILSILLPLLPSYRLFLKQIDCQLKSSKRLDSLKVEADKLITLSLQSASLDMQYRSRRLQDEIYVHRKSCPSIPDWLYNMLRDKHETEMYYNIQAKLKEISN